MGVMPIPASEAKRRKKGEQIKSCLRVGGGGGGGGTRFFNNVQRERERGKGKTRGGKSCGFDDPACQKEKENRGAFLDQKKRRGPGTNFLKGLTGRETWDWFHQLQKWKGGGGGGGGGGATVSDPKKGRGTSHGLNALFGRREKKKKEEQKGLKETTTQATSPKKV